ncbi:phosphotransferase [Pontibacter indicus]|uniref:Ser/Thr protein kinase RdoA involved in Cpx stress response, MazF antagonist n=1 Tax=Pontibacter indicus TaxID=1317125 RepID=A0A1R3XSJ1_9BACT|nr:phosphotransferase [Pontibacter indicus]SIT94022.1 Ser/Thr protein kinase RdoA involved in Cpx stress response, MazF antagonist [Pontibacter indicus]
MTYAPVISSILSPAYLAELVIQLYGFDGKSTCRILKTGINHSYLIATHDKKYVLRVYYYDWRKESEINEELQLLDYLRDNGMLVSYPIKDCNGKYINRIPALEGERFAVLFSFAEGESIRTPSEGVIYSLGVTMAKMHQLTINKSVKRKDYDANTLVSWAYQSAKEHFTEPSIEMEYFQRANSIISSEFRNADTANLRYGIVHLDLWYENMKVKNESQITVFDFDNCGNGWLFLDMAFSLMTLYRNEPNKENFESKKDSFYQGYESITSISEEEKRLIPYGGLAIWLHYTGIHIQRFDDFSNQFLSQEFLKFWIQSVNRWMEYNGIKIHCL